MPDPPTLVIADRPGPAGEPAALGLGSQHLDALLRSVRLDVHVDVHNSSSTGVRGAIALVVAAIARAAPGGEWDRLKLCPADDCAWAFFDESKNRSRRWCSMEVCGNRSKTRSYRQRTTMPD